MKRLLPALLVLICLPAVAIASDAAPSDFAYGLALITDKEASIYEVELPSTVYESVTRPDLGDVRVFNRDGELVPHTVQAARPDKPEADKPARLPFFPLYGEASRDGRSLSMRVKTGQDGTIVDVDAGPGEKVPADIYAYILDGSQLKSAPIRLDIEWQCDCENLVTRVSVDAGRDLTNWSRLVSNAALADLNYQGQKLSRNTIVLPRRGGPYMRILWPAGKKGAVITRITAYLPSGRDMPPRRWKTLSASRSDDEPNEYLFDAGGYFPVDRLRIRPGQRNTFARVTLLSRNRSDDPWRRVYGGLVYNLTVEGGTLESDEIRTTANRDRRYLLRVDPGGGGLGRGLPALDMGWTAQKLYFVARGRAPFTLAFGNAAAPARPAPMDPLLKDIEDRGRGRFIRLARLGSRKELGGPDRLKKPKPPPPWKTYILWAVLVAGVLLLGIMAWRLYRQMTEDKAPGDPEGDDGR